MESSITVTLGATINTGNFNSVRVEYSMTDKIRNYESPEDAYERVELIVEKRLNDRIAEERADSGVE